VNWKRLALSIVAVFAFIFVSDFVIHGKLLAETYKATASVWRPESEMMSYMPFMTLGQLVIAAFFCLIFTYGYQGRGAGEGVRYGLYMGGFSAGPMLGQYAYLPVPGSLVFTWVFAMLFQAIVSGIIVASIYKPAGKRK
jgi:hypothetical protein